jgi:hypothetical protein
MSIFNQQMSADIVKAVEESYQTFFPNNKSAQYNHRAHQAWQDLAADINSRYLGSNVTAVQVKEKYKNLKKAVKKEYTSSRK